jgi:hypothetical protein
MKKLIVYFFSIIFFSSCENDEFIPREINLEIIGSGNLYGDGFEDILPGNYVITNESTWNILLNKIDINPNTTDSFTTTNIDFNNYQIIAVFDEIRPNPGRTIGIQEIIENQNSIHITVLSLGPGGALNVITQPFQIVKIPLSSKPIFFQ